ncbi:phosphoglycerate mutase [Bacillus sp. LL01]|uniref:histidine phosphatase family protein n=1 Tax=Bacillus sp. LL01 TaxID=1665556 RepID=UPI00064D2368|nr:histidine phosphatase family protein [Bacillus sp. LL01]KMJ59883.1 phosphoglycerate mutase [Bacillus sp. LL01]
MKVGLIRHFKVARGYPNSIVSSQELLSWMEEYDVSEVVKNEVDLGSVEWTKCYSSDLPRAQTTAKAVYSGDIHLLKELREIQLAPVLPSNARLPLRMHLLFIRAAWLFNHKSQPVSRKELTRSLSNTLDNILSSKEKVLIVSHGGIMIFLRKELIRRGYRGPEFKIANNGELYVFER